MSIVEFSHEALMPALIHIIGQKAQRYQLH
jgi:hypothetical protein